MSAASFMLASQLLADREAYPAGSAEWLWRTRAAWKLDQLAREVPADKWTEWTE